MRTHRPYIRTLDRLKRSNLTGRLIGTIERVMPPNTAMFHDAILRAGPPDDGQPLRYLPYNRQTHRDGDVTISLSLVVLFNNPLMERFFLQGIRERISRWVYRFACSDMDRFIRSVRLDWNLLHMMADLSSAFSLMGIVQRDEIRRKGLLKRHCRFVSPLLLVATEDAASHDYLLQFETRHTRTRVKTPLLPWYRSRHRLPE